MRPEGKRAHIDEEVMNRVLRRKCSHDSIRQVPPRKKWKQRESAELKPRGLVRLSSAARGQ